MKDLHTAERVSQRDASDNYVFQRSILAYHKAAEVVSGDVLEIGTGSGYGVEIIAPKTQSFITIDKSLPPAEVIKDDDHVEFHQMRVPPLTAIPSSSCDYVITFQVIEHIKNDFSMIAEIYRVLRPGGKLIITTPNKPMSLTRNPWHVREYTPDQFKSLLSSSFHTIEAYGVFGNSKVMDYYNKNRDSVNAILKYDILKMNRWLPRPILRIPYDIMNRRNRRKLLNGNNDLTTSIKMSDYYIAPVSDKCFDLFYVAEK